MKVNETQTPLPEVEGTLRAAETDGQSCVTGRELDALIAEHVMQWKRVHSERDEGDDREDVAWMLHKAHGVLKGEPYTWGDSNLHDRTFAKWSPSTDIAAAMEVFEKLRDTGYSVILEPAINNQWCVTVDNFEEAAPTIPEAICRAATQAVESQDTPASSPESNS